MRDANWATKLPRRLFARLNAALRGFVDHDGLLLAAATAYYFALSLFPLMLILVAGLGFALRSTAAGQDAREQLLEIIEQQASPELSQQIGRALEVVSDRALASGPIGFLVLIITAIMIFSQIDYAFDRIWHVPEQGRRSRFTWIRRLLFRRLKALLRLVGAGAFVFVGTVASLLWSAAQTHLPPAMDMLPEAGSALGLALNVGLNLLAFTVIYRFVPATRVRWGDALRGACVAALLWEAGRQILEVYLVHQGYPTAYGVIGSFMAIMLWAYYAMLVVFFGAEYTRVAGEMSGPQSATSS